MISLKHSIAGNSSSMDKKNNNLSKNNKDNNLSQKIQNIYNRVKNAFSPKKNSLNEKIKNYNFSTNEIISKYKYFRQFNLQNSPKTINKTKNFNICIKNPFFPYSINNIISNTNTMNTLNYNGFPINNNVINYYNNIIGNVNPNEKNKNKNMTNNNMKNAKKKNNERNLNKEDYFVPLLSQKEKNNENQNNDNFPVPDVSKKIGKDKMYPSKPNDFLGRKRLNDSQSDEKEKEKKGKKIKNPKSMDIDYENTNENEILNEDDIKNGKEKKTKKKERNKSSSTSSKPRYPKKRSNLKDGIKCPVKIPKKKVQKKMEKEENKRNSSPKFCEPEENIINKSGPINEGNESSEINSDDNINEMSPKFCDVISEPELFGPENNNYLLPKEKEIDNDLNKSINNSFSLFNEDNIRYNNQLILNNILGDIEGIESNKEENSSMQVEENEKEKKKVENENNLEENEKNIEIYKDKQFLLFERDLDDYMEKIIDIEREKNFFKKILPDSVDFVKEFFDEDNDDIPIDTPFPLYKNERIQLNLLIESTGRVIKNISVINP